jgi:hypothetical protein
MCVYNPPACGRSSVVERMLPKHDIVGSNPIARSAAKPGVWKRRVLHIFRSGIKGLVIFV